MASLDAPEAIPLILGAADYGFILALGRAIPRDAFVIGAARDALFLVILCDYITVLTNLGPPYTDVFISIF